jgi:hypothetical protein
VGKRIFYMLLCVLVFTAMFSGTALGQDSETRGPGQSGTTLIVTKTAEGFWTKAGTYDWDIEKYSHVIRPVIGRDNAYDLFYTINVNRLATSTQSEQFGVRGYITVTNGGDRPTENLKIVDQIQYQDGSSGYNDLPGATLTIIPSEQLLAGETRTYPYEMTFVPVEGATYRNTVKVTITNHSGHLDEEFGPNPKADFSIPSSASETTEDETAILSDFFVCPEGFTCEISDEGPWALSGSSVIQYTLTVTNVTAPCSRIIDLVNTATLTEGSTGETRTSSNTVSIFTGCCVCQP